MKLLAFPLKKELKYFVAFLESKGIAIESTTQNGNTVYTNEEYSWILSACGHGKVQFAIGTQRVCKAFESINEIYCIGAAGGLEKSLRVGDIVIGKTTVEHDFKKKFNSEESTPEFEGNSDLIANLYREPNDFSFKIYLDRIASGDEDIVDPSRAETLMNETKCIAVAWEGAGGARAAAELQIPFLEARGISDNCNSETPEDFNKNLPAVMANLANLFLNAKKG